ncbi:MAG: glycosyltransferase family 4 protein, partial [Bacteroidetes bacterium]|nr:glycosyltransferase family 4 protein [Bacteroidota bacterium]
VIKRLSEQRDDFECYMIGDGVDFEVLKHYSDKLGLTDKFVFFAGLKENDELVEAMNDADFMIMFSNYENLPVVILESYSCGVPVISTKVGGIHEHLNENLGLLVKPKDEDEFYEKINFFLDNLNKYNKDKIRKYSVDHFSNEVIGQSLYEVYKQILY